MRFVLSAIALLGWVTQEIQASPITYTLTTMASGKLGATPFTNAPVTLIFAGDTSNIAAGTGMYANTLGEAGSATMIISGLGATTLTDPAFILSTFDNTSLFGLSGVVIGDNTNGTGVLAATGPVFFGYDLQTFGPVTSGGGVGNGGGPGNTFPTNAGTLEFGTGQDNVGSSFTAVATQTLTGDQGGTTSAPVYLVGGAPIGEITGTISGVGAEDYYWFGWGGGVFAATASITGASGGASYLFSAGVAGACNSIGSGTLNSGDSFSDAISAGNLPAGQYCIGLDANSASDPNFSLAFNTPVSGTPEPSTFVLLSAGLAVITATRRARRAKS
jgi:hypothetical protein